MRQLPYPSIRKVLDICCGPGRHSQALTRAGYQVIGVDLDWSALVRAQQATGRAAAWVQLDMQHLSALTGPFDAALCLWQSFGFFDDQNNAAVLQAVSCLLRPGGRFVLDIYHRRFFAEHQGSHQIERRGQTVSISNTLQGNRLTAQLDYGDGKESFHWQLYTPQEIRTLADGCGLRCLLACTLYDEHRPAAADQPRMQLVFEREKLS